MAAQFAFVSCGPDATLGGSERSQIRSHCMKGKNKREGSRRSIREAKRAARQALEAAKQDMTVLPKYDTSYDMKHYLPLLPDELRSWMPKIHTSLFPPLGSDITRFSRISNVPTYEVMRQVLTFSELSYGPYMYTVEGGVDFDTYQIEPPFWPFSDDAFIYNILLINSALRDYAQRQPLSTATLYHLGRTLTLLSQKLSDNDGHLMDSTTVVALCLAVIAAMFGDFRATGTHLQGLKKIISLRGGAEFLAKEPKLQFKFESVDLIWCLTFGAEPRFLSNVTTWDSCFTSSPPSCKDPKTLTTWSKGIDSRLVTAFNDLQQLVGLINTHAKQKTKLSALIFQSKYSSIQSRLLYLKEALINTSSEWICLGALAFLSTTFRLPGRPLKYQHLEDRVRGACSNFDTSNPKLHDLMFWFVLICGFAVSEFDEQWMDAKWREFVGPDLTYAEVRERLEKVMWMGCVQDDMGKERYAILKDRMRHR